MRSDAETELGGLEDEAAFEASLLSDAVVEGSSTNGSTHVMPPHEGRLPPVIPPGENKPGWAGKTLGHFKLLRLIGEGAMGLVIQALDVNLQRVVALKVLRKRIEGLNETQKIQQFLREAQAAAQIEHPNVVRVYEINQHQGWWYIAMEMLDGGTLQRVVKAAGPLPPSRACPVIADAASALAAAHELGILHRDVKPSNLFITRSGRCKLTDFGLVRLSTFHEPVATANKSVGTPQFMAPEVIRGEQQTPAIDVYGLGASLYYALTGKPPYVGKKVADVYRQHLHAPVPDLREVCPDCPVSLAELIRRAMAKAPLDRPSAADLAAALHAEAVDWRADDSTTASRFGSAVLGGLTVTDGGSRLRAPITAPRRAVAACVRALRWLPSKWGMVALAASAIVISAAVLLYTFGGLHGRSARTHDAEHAALSGRFPKAPGTYGVLPAGATPVPLPADTTPPAFSWRGRVDTRGLNFVASKLGRHFYAIDDPAADLISIQNFVGYRTADDARAAGLTMSP